MKEVWGNARGQTLVGGLLALLVLSGICGAYLVCTELAMAGSRALDVGRRDGLEAAYGVASRLNEIASNNRHIAASLSACVGILWEAAEHSFLRAQLSPLTEAMSSSRRHNKHNIQRGLDQFQPRAQRYLRLAGGFTARNRALVGEIAATAPALARRLSATSLEAALCFAAHGGMPRFRNPPLAPLQLVTPRIRLKECSLTAWVLGRGQETVFDLRELARSAGGLGGLTGVFGEQALARLPEDLLLPAKPRPPSPAFLSKWLGLHRPAALLPPQVHVAIAHPELKSRGASRPRLSLEEFRRGELLDKDLAGQAFFDPRWTAVVAGYTRLGTP